MTDDGGSDDARPRRSVSRRRFVTATGTSGVAVGLAGWIEVVLDRRRIHLFDTTTWQAIAHAITDVTGATVHPARQQKQMINHGR